MNNTNFKINIKGTVQEEHDEWYLETDDKEYNAEILAGIDDILNSNNQEVLHFGDELELTIKVKRI